MKPVLTFTLTMAALGISGGRSGQSVRTEKHSGTISAPIGPQVMIMGSAFSSGRAPSCAGFVKSAIARNGYQVSAANDAGAILHSSHYSALIMCLPGTLPSNIVVAVASSAWSSMITATAELADGFGQLSSRVHQQGNNGVPLDLQYGCLVMRGEWHAALGKQETLMRNGGYTVEPSLTTVDPQRTSFVASNGKASVLIMSGLTTDAGPGAAWSTAVVVASPDRGYATTMRDEVIALLQRR